MKTKTLLIGILGTIILASCSTSSRISQVKTDQDKGVDFSSFKTYQLAVMDQENNHLHYVNEFNQKRITNSIIGHMGQKGLSLSEEPEVLLAFGLNIQSSKSYTTYGHNYGLGSGYSTSSEYTNYSGNITLALIDKDTNELLWYGSSSKEINGDPENAKKNINKVVDQIFDTFPINHFE